ncbi:MAG: hypothetical protein AAF441_18960 [Pseudomonadota bacterium]
MHDAGDDIGAIGRMVEWAGGFAAGAGAGAVAGFYACGGGAAAWACIATVLGGGLVGGIVGEAAVGQAYDYLADAFGFTSENPVEGLTPSQLPNVTEHEDSVDFSGNDGVVRQRVEGHSDGSATLSYFDSNGNFVRSLTFDKQGNLATLAEAANTADTDIVYHFRADRTLSEREVKVSTGEGFSLSTYFDANGNATWGATFGDTSTTAQRSFDELVDSATLQQLKPSGSKLAADTNLVNGHHSVFVDQAILNAVIAGELDGAVDIGKYTGIGPLGVTFDDIANSAAYLEQFSNLTSLPSTAQAPANVDLGSSSGQPSGALPARTPVNHTIKQKTNTETGTSGHEVTIVSQTPDPSKELGEFLIAPGPKAISVYGGSPNAYGDLGSGTRFSRIAVETGEVVGSIELVVYSTGFDEYVLGANGEQVFLNNHQLGVATDGSLVYQPKASSSRSELLLSSGGDVKGFSFFSSEDEPGNGTSSLTSSTHFGDGTGIARVFGLDANGDPVTEARLEAYQFDRVIDGGAIGSAFGSSVGSALAGQNVFAQVATGSVLAAVLGNLGQAIDTYFTDHALVGQPELTFAEALDTSFPSFGANVLQQIQGASIGAAAGFLVGELGEALGLESGFEGQLLQAVAARTIGATANTVLNNAIAISNGSASPTQTLFSGLNPGSLAEAGAGAVGSLVGGYLARELVTAESQVGAIGGSIGGAVGSAIGFGLAGAGPLSGLLGSTALTGLFSAAFGQAVGQILANAILPGVGAFIGTILGTLLGDLFDDLFGNGGYPKATAAVSVDFETGLYYESGTNAANGGGAQLALVTSLAERSDAIMDSFIKMMGGENANSHSPTIHYYQVADGSASAGLHITVIAPTGNVHYQHMANSTITGQTADEAVEDAVLAAIKAIQIKGGDLYLKRAVHNSSAETLRDFSGNLKIAEDYKSYLKDKAVIDALIAEKPNSAFAAGWLVTLLRAEELGLTTWQESDFYGGLEGLLQSLELESAFGVTAEDAVLEIEDTVLADQSIRKDLIIRAGPDAAAEVIARINGFETAAGFTTQTGTGTVGTPGKDIWQAADGAGESFTDGAAWSDEHSHDILTGGSGADTIDGGEGWDFIRGGGGNDILNGGAHEDVVYGQAGNDTILGDAEGWLGGSPPELGTDPDSAVGADANDGSTREWFGFKPHESIAIGNYNYAPERTPYGADKLYGGTGNDIVVGLGGSDLISGGDGDDQLYGGNDGVLANQNTALYDGDDLIEGGAGADMIDGGLGHDTASYAGSAEGVTIDLNLAGAQGGAGDGAGDVLAGIEDLIGSDHADTLTGDVQDNILHGGAGADILDGLGGSDIVSYFGSAHAVNVDLAPDPAQPGRGVAQTVEAASDGTQTVIEEDTLWHIEGVIGSELDDVLHGSDAGPGMLLGRRGDDLFTIAFDDVEVAAGSHATRVEGGAGFDTLSLAQRTAGATIDLTRTGPGNSYSGIEHLIGSSSGDMLTAGVDTELLQGGAGNDQLFGRFGNDTLIFNAGDGADLVDDTQFFSVASDEQALRAGGAEDRISFGTGIEFRHIFGELKTEALPGFLPGPQGARTFEIGTAISDFSQAGFELGIRDTNIAAQDYVTSLTQVSDTIDIAYGGFFEGFRFADTITHGSIYQNGNGEQIDNRWYSYETYEVEANAGQVEILQFADSGHLELGEVRTFLTGSAADDVAQATGQATWIFTGEGTDQLTGSAQGDILVGGLGDDIADGGSGDDQYAYWLGDGHDIISDTGGRDNLVFGGGITWDHLSIRTGTLSIQTDPSSFADTPAGSNGTDLRIDIVDPADASSVLGSVTISNYLDRTKMVESFRLSGLNAAVVALSALAIPQAAAATDSVELENASSLGLSLSEVLAHSVGTGFDDVLAVMEGESRLEGHEGDDTLIGDDGENTLQGGAGADTLNGGLGIDLASYADAPAAVVIDMSLAQQAERTGGDFAEEGDRLLSIEGVIGSSFDDIITGNRFDNILRGGPGADQLSGAGGNDILIFSLAVQTSGIDVYDGGKGSDAIIFEFTADEFTRAIETELESFLAFATQNADPAATAGPDFSFSSFDLTVTNVEQVEVLVDGMTNLLTSQTNDDPGAAAVTVIPDLDPDPGNTGRAPGATAGTATPPAGGQTGDTGSSDQDDPNAALVSPPSDAPAPTSNGRDPGATAGAPVPPNDPPLNQDRGMDTGDDVNAGVIPVVPTSTGAPSVADRLARFPELFTEDPKNVIVGDDGDNRLVSMSFDEVLIGAAGSDTFEFAGSFGADTIVGFDALDDDEKIDLSGVSGITDFADLQTNHLFVLNGHAIIANEQDSITLAGVTLSHLNSLDFAF